MTVAILGGILILLGEGLSSTGTATALRLAIRISESPVADFLAKLGLLALGVLAFFGGLLVIVGGLAFGRGALSQGQFLITLGTGASAVGIFVRILTVALEDRELRAIHYLFTTLSGIGLIAAVVARILASQHLVKWKESLAAPASATQERQEP